MALMLQLMWTFSLLCAAGCQVTLVTRPGHNVSLTCNVTSGQEVVWLWLRSNRLLPLLMVRRSKLAGSEDTVNVFHADRRRVTSRGQLSSGVVLHIQEAQVEDGGLYSCVGRCTGSSCEHSEVQLAVQGADRPSAAMRQPCWTAGACVLPAMIVFGCLVGVGGVYLCLGKAGVFCPSCAPPGGQEEALHYSSLKFADLPRPSSRGATRVPENSVTYSTLANHKATSRPRDSR